jgi:putative hemolysin
MFASGPGFQILLIFALIVLNGVFAMSEIAVVSARKSRLKQRADAGDVHARRALELAEDPSRFLSTVQIGITLIGVFAGAYGGASLARHLDDWFNRFPSIERYSGELSLAIVVATITYLSLVIGELVPKRIGLHHPERIASFVAGPMQKLAVVAAPAVHLLSASTDAVLRLFRIREPEGPAVTEADVAALLDAGTAAGVFEEEEHDLVERVFWLGDQRVSALMTPRRKIEWLDIHDPPEAHREELIRNRFSYYLVCDGDVDHVVGIVRVKDLLAALLEGRPMNLHAAMRKPLLVPESLRALRLLEMFRESGIHIAVVLDEYGGVEGIVTLNDVLEEIAGDLASHATARVTRRPDGSWLVDASVTMNEFWDYLGLQDRRTDDRAEYHTLGGLVVTELGRIPQTSDCFEAHDLRFEVVDMDGNRVDKVLVTRIDQSGNGAEAP